MIAILAPRPSRRLTRLILPLLIRVMAGLLTSVLPASGQTPPSLDVTVEVGKSKNVVPPDFVGLSFEAPTLMPNQSGDHYFNPQNAVLVNLMRLIGVKSLRFGGTTVDGNNYHISHLDIDNLFAFASAVDARVIYSLRLRNYPGENKTAQYQAEAEDARYILDKYSGQFDCFCLGNEPNVYYADYSHFVPDWIQLSEAVNQLSPQARFCGPGSWNSTENSWVLPFAKQFRKQPNIAWINEHIYQSQAPKYRSPPGAPAEETLHQQLLARTEMLAKSDYSSYYNKLVPELDKLGLPYRIEETNSFSGGGVPNASDAYSASLWGLNYLCWWASHEARGLNFHTGYHSPYSDRLFPYSVFGSQPNGEQIPLGLSYSLLAFKMASPGKITETTVTKNAPNLNVTAYSFLCLDNTLSIILINQEWGPAGRATSVTIHLPGCAISQVQSMALVESSADISFRPGSSSSGAITLGGSSVSTIGTWSGGWSVLSPVNTGTGATFTLPVTVPPASALLLKFTLTATPQK